MWYRILSAWVATLAGSGLVMADGSTPMAPSPLFGGHQPAATPPTATSPLFGGHQLSSQADTAIAAESEAVGPRVWGEVDYLLMFERRQRVPLLVGTLKDSLVNTADGVSSTATPLYPTNGRISFGGINGLSARIGGQVADGFGLDIGGFALERSSLERTFTSEGTPSLIRNYTSGATGRGVNFFVAKIAPNDYAGAVRVQADSQLWGIDANFRRPWYHLFADRTDLLAGVRYLNLRESLNIDNASFFPNGGVIAVSDSFRTQNHIYVAQVGLQSFWYGSGRWDLNYFGKIGLGGASQRVEIAGSNFFSGLPDQNTGLYTQANNIGNFERNKFVAVGELGLKLGYRITERLHAQVGYNVLYVSSVVRPGPAIDPVVNDSKLRFVKDPPADSGSPRPTFSFARASTDFYAQGLTLGLSLQY